MGKILYANFFEKSFDVVVAFLAGRGGEDEYSFHATVFELALLILV